MAQRSIHEQMAFGLVYVKKTLLNCLWFGHFGHLFYSSIFSSEIWLPNSCCIRHRWRRFILSNASRELNINTGTIYRDLRSFDMLYNVWSHPRFVWEFVLSTICSVSLCYILFILVFLSLHCLSTFFHFSLKWHFHIPNRFDEISCCMGFCSFVCFCFCFCIFFCIHVGP